MWKIRIAVCSFLLLLPIVLMLILDSAAWLSKWNLFSALVGTVVFLDLPIAVCLGHWFRPQWFQGRILGHYSLLPWFLISVISWAAVAGGMYLDILFNRGPENGFAVFCAYCLGWAYIWIFMIPVGSLYLLFLLFRSFLGKRN